MPHFHIPLVLFFLNLLKGIAADLCYASYNYRTYYRYCANGCCGYYYSRECCESYSWIAGVVVGAIVFIAVIVTIVIVCVKKSTIAGRVVGMSHGHTNAHVTVVSQSHQQPPPPGGMYGQYGQPNPYGPGPGPAAYPPTNPMPPPAYDPAYPPPKY